MAEAAEGGEGPLIEAAHEADAETSANAEDSAAAADAIAAEGQDEPKDAPVKIGYRTFSSGRDAMDYFHGLIQHLTKNQDLNEVRPTGLLLERTVAVVFYCKPCQL